MKRPFVALVLACVLGGCATLGGFGEVNRGTSTLWKNANDALAQRDFVRAEALFDELATDHAGSVEGRESLFYLGVIYLDPRNPDWDPVPAEENLGAYLGYLGNRDVRLFRYLEAQAFHEMAVQLNLPPSSRVEGLQPEEVVVVEERVLAPATQSRELAAEVEALRAAVAERDARIQSQQEELERIRRTLTTPARQ